MAVPKRRNNRKLIKKIKLNKIKIKYLNNLQKLFVFK